ncbi:MAG: hypothetical protein GF401_17160 [Chitinivibrionales bacterium]|nr:hypothetical protein [Chitinivibrionales bacterium]
MACITLYADTSAVSDSDVFPERGSSQSSDSLTTEWSGMSEPEKNPRFNPLISGGLSTLMPGLGQIYTRNYIKGSLFLTTEVILGLVARDRYLFYSRNKKEDVNDWKDSVFSAQQKLSSVQDSLNFYRQIIDTTTFFDSAFIEDSLRFEELTTLKTEIAGTVVSSQMQYELERYDRREAKTMYHHMLFGLAGCTYFNIMDAVQGSRYFYDNSPKKPALAGWLSAVPGLGMGQIYNGALSKAGMITMVQFTLGFMSYNYHSLMRDCEEKILEMSDPNNPKNEFEDTFHRDWDSRRDEVFRKRNTYLWYSILFYFYGIFDAVVDAHLHDTEARMQLKPDLSISSEAVGFNLSLSF